MHTAHAEEMPPTLVILLFAVVASNVHHPCQFSGDGLQGNAHGNRAPSWFHLFRRFGRLFTDGAAGIKRGELLETVPMDRVSTGHFVRGVTTGKQIFLTHRTIRIVLALLAVVIVKEFGINTHATIVAVAKVFSATDTTKAAVTTMVGRFAGRHPQVANITVIASELNATLPTLVAVVRETQRSKDRDKDEMSKHFDSRTPSTDTSSTKTRTNSRFARLFGETSPADDFPNGESINQVMLIIVKLVIF